MSDIKTKDLNPKTVKVIIKQLLRLKELKIVNTIIISII